MRWPRPTARTFWQPGQLGRFLERTVPGPVPPAPAIDYAGTRAVLVAVGPRSSSGYRVEVLRVTERRGRIEVEVREATPALGDRVRTGLTFPYRLIAIRRTDKRVVVRWRGRP